MIPNKINIGGVDYTVEKKSDLNDGSRMLYGQIDYSETAIRLNPIMSESLAPVTVWHEIIHGILNQAHSEHNDDEQLIDALAYGINQVLRDNPKLIGMYKER